MIGPKKSKSSRRHFLERASIGGAGALLGLSSPQPLDASQTPASLTPDTRHLSPAASSFLDLLRPPDFVRGYETDKPIDIAKSGPTSWSALGITVEMDFSQHARARVALAAPEKPVSRIQLRWQVTVHSALRFLGDHWERGYGDLEWRGLIGDRVIPWYFLTHNGKLTHGYGVATRPNAMCFWRVDSAGVSLWLDVRNGGTPVSLGTRTLDLCTIVTREGKEGESAWQASRHFCALLNQPPCPLTPDTSLKPDTCHLTPGPVYGANNWYYAYGENCSAESILRDATLLTDLTGHLSTRPLQVIDDGWQQRGTQTGCCTGGPWQHGNAAFPDMPGLAAHLKGMGVRPGIWMRPLLTNDRGLEKFAIQRPQTDGELLLDPTTPEVRERIREDIAGLAAWGYELIKHDFSTADLFGRWGFSMRASLTDAGWSFHDRSRTTAEIVKDFYQAIREAAGDKTLILGCNTIGHLAAGIFDANRTGDDTSGREWDRTRKMGVNTLAFRSVQHGAFFATDADCVGITNAIPWSFNKQWLDLLSRSGTPLFVSAAPDALDDEKRKALREAFARAAVARPVAEPLDWLETTTPEKWKCDGETVTYDWYDTTGDTIL